MAKVVKGKSIFEDEAEKKSELIALRLPIDLFDEIEVIKREEYEKLSSEKKKTRKEKSYRTKAILILLKLGLKAYKQGRK